MVTFKRPSSALIKESELDSVLVSIFQLIFHLVGIMGITEALQFIFHEEKWAYEKLQSCSNKDNYHII